MTKKDKIEEVVGKSNSLIISLLWSSFHTIKVIKILFNKLKKSHSRQIFPVEFKKS